MRKLVTLYQLEADPSPIEGADAIELVHVKGWQCVAKKGEFKKGQFGLYFEVDSFVDTSKPAFSFLEKDAKDWQGKRGAIVKTRKFRGQLSQGLFLPLNLFPDVIIDDSKLDELLEYDFSDELDVYKYEKDPEVVEDRSHWLHKLIRKFVPRKYRVKVFGLMKYFIRDKRAKGAGGRIASIPSFLRKTDEERVQNIWNKFTPEQKQEVYEATIKLDGSSGQYYVKDGVFGLTSRNVKRGLEDGSHFAYIAKKYNLPEALLSWQKIWKRNISICGEVMGPGIQSNREGLDDFEFFVFNIWDIDQQKYLSREERRYILNDLRSNSNCEIKSAPCLGELTLEPFTSIQDILLFAEGKSITNPVREGVVFKRLDGSFSFKVISNKYLLKQVD